MTTPQPQQPSQPVYQRDLSLILDRVHTKFVEYANAKDDALAAQMRVGFAEAYQRDMEAYQRHEALLKRIENVETTVHTVIDLQREMMSTMQAMQHEMRVGFASLEEKINELTTRVVRLEGGLKPPTTPES